MGQIYDTMLRFFQDDNWPIHEIEGVPAIVAMFQGANGQWSCLAQAREAEYQFIFYSRCPVMTPDEKRMAMAEFITRANYGLVIGNFEMDFSDGELRYKTSIDVEGDEISTALVEQVVYANVLTMDRYLPGIIGIIHAHVAPLQAIGIVEGRQA